MRGITSYHVCSPSLKKLKCIWTMYVYVIYYLAKGKRAVSMYIFFSLRLHVCLGCKVGFEKNRVKEKENWMKALHSKHLTSGETCMTCTHVPIPHTSTFPLLYDYMSFIKVENYVHIIIGSESFPWSLKNEER